MAYKCITNNPEDEFVVDARPPVKFKVVFNKDNELRIVTERAVPFALNTAVKGESPLVTLKRLGLLNVHVSIKEDELGQFYLYVQPKVIWVNTDYPQIVTIESNVTWNIDY